jgi:hypothetical protein
MRTVGTPPSGQTSGVVYQNGASTVSAGVVEIYYYNHLVYQENGSSLWWDWVSGAWASTTSLAPPVANASSISVTKNVTYPFALTDFQCTCNGVGSVTITSLPADGTLVLTGTGNVTTNQIITATDINSGLLTFVPTNNSITSGSFQFKVTDSTNGRISTAAATMSITITGSGSPFGPLATNAGYNHAFYTNYSDYQNAAGTYQAANDGWGPLYVSGSFSGNTGTFPAGTTFRWNVNTGSNWSPQAYPNVMFIHGWNGGIPGTGGLYSNEISTTISALNTLSCTYNVSISGATTQFDVLWDLWLTDSGNGNIAGYSDPHNINWGYATPSSSSGECSPAPSCITAPDVEIEIFVHVPSAYWGGGGSLNIGGLINHDVSDGTNYSNYLNNGGVGWKTVALSTAADELSGTLDIKAILLYLASTGHISSTYQISDIRLGAEMAGSNGSLTINTFNCTWN